jgi:hypothetical protein
MKTPQRAHRSFVYCAAQAATISIGLVLNAALLPHGNAAISPGPRNHVLFVGTDLSVKEGNEFYHVVGAKKGALQIEKDRRLAEVRLGQGANIKVSRGVKLSSLSATISDVKTESIDRASARAQLAAMQSSMMLMSEAGDQEDRVHGNMTVLSAVGINPEAAGGAAVSRANLDEIQAGLAASYVGALPGIERSTTSANTLLAQNIQTGPIDDEVTLDASDLPGLKSMTSSGLGGATNLEYSLNRVKTGTAEVELTFDVSSAQPLEHAYILVVANYASLNKPDEVARQISAREFERIDTQPKRVKMIHAASMNGLLFKKFDIALFSNGQEVATNLSEKRLALTSDQAFQFFLIDYLSTHKGATRPPTPMLMTPRTEFRRDLATIETNQTIYADVDKMGNTLAISTDASGNQSVPASVESALRNVRFMPALRNGVPVGGQAKVMLAQLAN